MKKSAKVKTSKKSKSKGPDLPDFVAGMMKLVERLEIMERKMDTLMSKVSNLPSDMRHAVQSGQVHFVPSHQPVVEAKVNHNPPQERRERVLFDAICGDCRKNCKVPFRPSENRPVYCPECFAIRKAGHTPKDPTAHVVVPHHMRNLKASPAGENKAPVASKGKKASPKAEKKSSKKKKK
jgi:CxxC-x17-CxxC domain-containing protein